MERNREERDQESGVRSQRRIRRVRREERLSDKFGIGAIEAERQ